ncbi:hypothetical protein BJX64DRAFT_290397 [Aspergillus heterothallicus]
MTDPKVFEEQVRNILKFTGATRPEPEAVFILVLGETGSGKTTFVSECSGKSLEIGHDLSSCTSKLTISSFHHHTKTIYIVDTPGFDDTNHPDSEILTHIAHYLAVAYANNIYLSGVIIMHRISDPRLSGTARLNLDMFKHMLGEAAYENAVVVTSMWSTPPTDLEVQREEELEQGDGILAEVLRGGGRAFRYAGSDVEEVGRSVPLSVIDHILCQARAGPVVLQIQSELVDERRELLNTSAGQFLADRQVLELRKEYGDAIADLRPTILHMGSGLVGADTDTEQCTRRRRCRQQIQIHADAELAGVETALKETHTALSKSVLQMHHDEARRIAGHMQQMEAELDSRIKSKQERLENLTRTSTSTTAHLQGRPRLPNPSSQNSLQENNIPDPPSKATAITSTKLEVMHLRREIQELRLEIQRKQAVNNSVRHAFRKGMLFDTVGRVVGGAVAAAVPALVAGSLCIVM